EELFDFDVAGGEQPAPAPAQTVDIPLDGSPMAPGLEAEDADPVARVVREIEATLRAHVDAVRHEERERIQVEIREQTALIRKRAETIMRDKIRQARARDRERMQGVEAKIRSHYARLTELANRITHQKAEIQRRRRELEEKLEAVDAVHREIAQLGRNMSQDLDGLEEMMPGESELNELTSQAAE
ncbi:MAG: hypothetical protein ACU85V_13050, partial [Gammaproteobacteria bacterium]